MSKTKPHILERQEFDPIEFLGKGWSIDEQVGNRIGDHLNAINIVTKDYLKEGELHICGVARLRRIKSTPEDIQLDVNDFLALWSEEGHNTLEWLYDTKGINWLSFWGIIFQNPTNDHGVLCLCRRDDGSWEWSCNLVDSISVWEWDWDNPAGVLAIQ